MLKRCPQSHLRKVPVIQSDHWFHSNGKNEVHHVYIVFKAHLIDRAIAIGEDTSP